MCQERMQIIAKFLEKAFKNFVTKNNGKRPEQIVIFRDGVGGPTYEEFVLKNEGMVGSALQQAIGNFDQNYNPKVLFVILNKKVQTRLFEKVNGEVCNPGPGTFVDTGIVENDGANLFDFYMVANDNPKTATALPVHYKIVTNTTGMTKKEVQELIYAQCYSYQGFGGPIKVPACVKYAEKLANYAHDTEAPMRASKDSVFKGPNPNLSSFLHYL